ncbi:Pkinase-domain-containing protein [Paraphaeosphaeria sporulosa]|uniref:non-specific serine/threonine protein kinase n=1 Tax=Paraphaeosphaeria sporulosa TaxID=1460663 RepID=A0A177CBH3_9PLEO|nr:Pkinase-domain-containing protein [Paraphaeosphaeria sporulosa]OAG04965.1 Pkinase-domain-containing protein [Paraphaeosphaeria sporulosa]
MDHSFHGRPPTRRRTALGDATLRANEDHRLRSPRSTGDKLNSLHVPTSSPNALPHNESLVPNGTLTVRHEAHTSPSPQHKRLSAVMDECRPRNTKRDSEISNASTTASTGGRRKTHIGPWQLGRTVGKGGCSRVRVVRHSGTGIYGAAKIISKATAEKVRALSMANLCDSAQYDPTLFTDGKVIPLGLEREICIMKLLDHPYIVKLFDIWENRNELYLIMEYVEGGELFGYIGKNGGLEESDVVHIFRQIIAALWYCHRLNIFHRDLKPENILLDRETMTIKLVDFGMAALQPHGKKLTTPCGSPHYAAPEVIESRSYDGGKADVWSCGVILYVLLTGMPPFNYDGHDGEHENLKPLFQAITRADYVMPDYLSWEAKDLIRSILVPNPKRRISIEKIWEHPFMRKYDRKLGFHRTKEHANSWIRPHAPVEWKPLTRPTIDREILRYMRTLWHSEKEETIIRRLLNDDATNHEKYFYAALQKYRNEQIENYMPSPHHAVGYSHSDHHHHARRSPTAKGMLALPSKNHKRSQSGYSILNDEHLYSQHSFYEPPPTEVSYDPFRASREPVLPNQDLHQNITVHRGSSSTSRRMRPTTALGHRTGSSLRVQALTNSKRGSVLTRTSSKRSTPSHRSAHVRRSSVSRSSLASSYLPSSPPVFVRPKTSVRRGVSFSHLRRSSVATTHTEETPSIQCTPKQGESSSSRRGSVGSSLRSGRPSTVGNSPSVRPLPKVAARPVVPRLRVRKADSPSKYIQSAARKVSTELEKHMDEAFNRSSIGSSVRTSTTSDPRKDASGFDTPPTTFSNRDSSATGSETPEHKAMYQHRPLPAIPNETPNTFLQRKLAETRAEIARRLEESGDSTEHFNEVIENLDRLMMPAVHVAKRTCSAPAKSPEHPVPLHVIPEEAKEDRFEPYVSNYRAFTEPFGASGHGRLADDSTIRVVEQSPTHIAPLSIRKKSEAGRSTKSENSPLGLLWPGPIRHTSAPSRPQAEAGALTVRTNQFAQSHGAPEQAETKEATIKKKKSSWFRRTPEERERPQEAQPKAVSDRLQIPEAWQGLDDRIKDDPPKASTPAPDLSKQSTKHSDGSANNEFPMRGCGTTVGKSEGSGALKGFFGLFAKKSKEGKRPLELGEYNFSTSSILSNFDTDNTGEAQTRPGPPDFQMNWLSRFLHIKPASRALCFHARRGKVRQELVYLLRDWQRYGIRDVTCDRNTNVIHARVDKNNRLNLKPVAFVIELFVVLEDNKRANLCLGRFTQTRGAASSFRRAVEVIEDICREKHILIEDEQKKAAMCEILN